MKKEIYEIIYDVVVGILCSVLAHFLIKNKKGKLTHQLLMKKRVLFSSASVLIITVRQKLSTRADDCRGTLNDYLQTIIAHKSISSQWRKVSFSTVIGMWSWSFVSFGFLVAASFGTGINERTLPECAAGFMFCLFLAWFVNWYFHKLVKA